ncbi:exopolysaccharide biosynthesis polyprenyl glycosylphosphotransferase [Clostridium botulinum]|nr:exopolysaccharide biosynthesis polyprenyl glycosylphosphotransferase [Clostridium botulinum]
MSEIHKNLEEIQIEYKDEYSKSLMYFVIKRIIDLLGSIIGLTLLSPILIITAIVIKIDSKGPIFFIQKRVGKDGQCFNMYKFRSMVIDAEDKLSQLKDKNEMSGPMFKMKNDPRVTKIGSFIRKTSIDELPQLLNVLKGDMSLVGPRPNLPREVMKFTDYQKNKLIAQPGITCYWQVMGRNNIDFEQWIELDIKYVKDRNVWVDIKLIFKTVRVLFGDDNAA